ncbi:MAG: choice-of-anchor D domain-containing protein [Pseudomonadota bacterium]
MKRFLTALTMISLVLLSACGRDEKGARIGPGNNIIDPTATPTPTGTPGPVARLETAQIVDFGEGFVGQVSERTLTIQNAGAAAATELNSSSPATPFAFKGGVFPGTGGTCPKNGKLDPGTQCTLVVSLAPNAEGSFSADLSISYNDGEEDQVMTAQLKASGSFCDPGASPFGYGSGTAENDPFLICSPAHLRNLAQASNMNAYLKLTKDLDLAGETINPIGNEVIPFGGIFDGNKKILSNLTISKSGQSNVGLFGVVANSFLYAEIKDLGLTNINVSGYDNVGGLVGRMKSGAIHRSFTTGRVTSAHDRAGGLVGWAGETGNAVIQDSYAQAVVSAANIAAGGVVGESAGGCAINRTYAAGQVGALNGNVGGLVGKASYWSDCYSSFWDEKLGNVYSNACGGGQGIPTYKFVMQSTFSGWDFDQTSTPIWKLTDTYPAMKWEP